MNSGRVIRGGLLITGGQIAVQGCGFLRNIIIARLLSPSDFGIAGALVMTASLVEMITTLNVGRNLVRHSEGDNLGMLASSHAVQMLQGIIASLLLIVVAWPMATIFRAPEALWAFFLLPVIPLMHGLCHNDLWRRQRQYRYGGQTWMEVVPQLATLAVAYPLALWLRDFSVLLWLLLGGTCLTVVISHIVATTPYRFGVSRDHLRDFWSFGWPLMIDGAVLFAVMHGERLIVGSHFQKPVLGAYTAAYLLTWAPTMLLAKVWLAVGLPMVASTREQKGQMQLRYRVIAHVSTATAMAVTVPFVVCGSAIVHLLFGAQYKVSSAMVAAMAIGQALRMLRIAPAILAMAHGDTLTPAIANSLRAGVVVVAWIAASRGAEIWVITALGAAGEFVAVVVCEYLVHRRHDNTLIPGAVSLVLLGGAAGSCLMLAGVLDRISVEPWIALLGGLVASSLILVLGIAVNSTTRRLVAELLSGRLTTDSVVPLGERA